MGFRASVVFTLLLLTTIEQGVWIKSYEAEAVRSRRTYQYGVGRYLYLGARHVLLVFEEGTTPDNLPRSHWQCELRRSIPGTALLISRTWGNMRSVGHHFGLNHPSVK